jgi:potassium efflux system protein
MPPHAETGASVLALSALLAVAALVHWGLHRIERRLPLILTRRAQGPGATHPDPTSPRAVERVAVGWLTSERAPLLQAARDAGVAAVGSGLSVPLFTLNERSYSARDLITLPLLLGALWIVVSALTRLVQSHVLRAVGVDRGAQETFGFLVRYLLTFLGALVVLHLWGVDVRSIAIVASVLGVGIGFGLQNLANNFVSGLVIGFERPIKPGDYVRIGEFQGTIDRIGVRSTTIITRDRVSILVPNSKFLEEEVVNWSHGDPTCRVSVPVGVAYGSDVATVRAALLEAARGHPDVLADPRPHVELGAFGDSALEFELEVFTRNPRRQKDLISDLNFRIDAAFRRHGVTIPFPQRDLHLRSPELAEALAALTRRHFTDGELAAAREALAARERGNGAAEAPAPSDPTAALDDAALDALVGRMRAPGGVAVADRRHLLAVYPQCFVGREAVDWIVEHEGLTRDEAVTLGQRLVERGGVRHVLDEHPFRDGNFFYRFGARADASYQ